MQCKVCDSEKNNREYDVPEMMFGMDEVFKYFECDNCKCLQIKNVPSDMRKYYPENYYSKSSQSSFSFKLKCEWMKHSLGQKNLKGALSSLIFGKHPLKQWSKNTDIDYQSKILDVGCGTGHLLSMMAKSGFENLTGVDPFIDEDIINQELTIYKKEISDLEGSFDLIMLHHSFEHMVNLDEVLSKLNTLLAAGGTILIRIPLGDCAAWHEYGINWFQIDAPRHFYLLSPKSLNILASKTGLHIRKTQFDSQTSQFWGSIQYQNGINHSSENSFAKSPRKSMFSIWDILKFKKRAKLLNEKGTGDQACFYLKKESEV
jgi:SAM-dependent methyltransferase